MVFRSTAIKQVLFPSQTPGSDTNLSEVFSSEVVNGEILKIDWQTNTNGSIFVIISGTSEILWSSLAPSGAGFQQAHPFIYGVTNLNVTGSPSAFVRNNIISPIALTGSGFEGGSITDFIVSYR